MTALNTPSDVSQTELLARGPEAQSGKLEAARTELLMATRPLRKTWDFDAMVK